MNAIDWLSTPSLRAYGRRRRAVVSLPLALLVMAGPAAAEQIPAVLKHHEIDFFYRTSVAQFSCASLQVRVARIFRALGARDDVEVRTLGCDSAVVNDDFPDTETDRSSNWRITADRFGNRDFGDDDRREQSTHVQVRMMFPVEVTPEVMKEIERDRSRRELVSRVTGNPSAAMNDAIVFPAERREVTLNRKTIDLEPDECQLIDQMAASAFRKLKLKVVRGHPHCDRNRISHVPLQVTVEALMPVIPTGPQLLPASESTEESGASAPSEPQNEGQSEPQSGSSTAPEPRPELP